MKSSLFVALSSVVLLVWLAASYVTHLNPEPRAGVSAQPLSAKHEAPSSEEREKTLLAEKQP